MRETTPGKTRRSPQKTGAPRATGSIYADLADFRLHLRRFLAFSETSARSAGVSPQQYQAMLVIRARSERGIPLKDLAGEMMLAPNGTVQLVDRMVRQGLVRREPSPSDRRSVFLILTPRGATTLRRLATNHVAELMIHRAHLVASLEHLEQLAPGARARPKSSDQAVPG